MLNTCLFEGRELDFGASPCNFNNKFTVIVGKNGTGKSRLLSSIIKNLINTHYATDLPTNRLPFPNDDFVADYGILPVKIIATSTNPFDKFPLEGRRVGSELYNYLGLRGLQTVNLGLTFMSRILASLIKALLRDQRRSHIIESVLRDLGYQPYIKARLLFQMTHPEIVEFNNAQDKVNHLLSKNFRSERNFLGKGYIYVDNVRKPYDRSDYDKAVELADAIENVVLNNIPSRLDVFIDSHGIREERYGFSLNHHHVALLEAGLLRLRDVGLQKMGAPEPFRINDASSGEQCVLMSLLGIASQLEHNSLVCIDEPEVCLHPEWQEQYIEKLISTFNKFHDCHFIIATHSPQIVANLRSQNCYVVDIESGRTIEAAALANRSADFQLAKVFKAPGFRNEYLSRELLATLATLSSEINPSKSTLNHGQNLLQLRDTLHPTDPLLHLMEMLSKALNEVQIQ